MPFLVAKFIGVLTIQVAGIRLSIVVRGARTSTVIVTERWYFVFKVKYGIIGFCLVEKGLGFPWFLSDMLNTLLSKCCILCSDDVRDSHGCCSIGLPVDLLTVFTKYPVNQNLSPISPRLGTNSLGNDGY